jgi:hypothetical protein
MLCVTMTMVYCLLSSTISSSIFARARNRVVHAVERAQEGGLAAARRAYEAEVNARGLNQGEVRIK